MSNYSSLKSAIDANIKANGRREITGPVLNAILNAVVNSLGDGYLFRGVAIPSTNPGTPDQNVAYLAITEGTYTHMGGLSVTDGELSVFSYNGAWSKIPLALVPTKTSQLDNDLRFVTSEEMGESLSSKQDTIQDLSEIRSGAALGATAYQKPSAGIPASDMTDTVQQAVLFAESTEKRSYNSSNPDGMGYLVLKKNKTFAEQVTEENTIYEIRYDFDLNGASVSIPSGCILDFKGGKILNGSLSGNGYIISSDVPCFENMTSVDGFINDVAFLHWFAKENSSASSKTSGLQILCDNSKVSKICLDLKNVELSAPIKVKRGLDLFGLGEFQYSYDDHTTIVTPADGFDESVISSLFYWDDSYNLSRSSIHGMKMVGGYKVNHAIAQTNRGYAISVDIYECFFKEFASACIVVTCCENTSIHDNYFHYAGTSIWAAPYTIDSGNLLNFDVQNNITGATINILDIRNNYMGRLNIGLVLYTGTDAVVCHNQFGSSMYAIYVHVADGILVIEKNYFEGVGVGSYWVNRNGFSGDLTGATMVDYLKSSHYGEDNEQVVGWGVKCSTTGFSGRIRPVIYVRSASSDRSVVIRDSFMSFLKVRTDKASNVPGGQVDNTDPGIDTVFFLGDGRYEIGQSRLITQSSGLPYPRTYISQLGSMDIGTPASPSHSFYLNIVSIPAQYYKIDWFYTTGVLNGSRAVNVLEKMQNVSYFNPYTNCALTIGQTNRVNINRCAIKSDVVDGIPYWGFKSRSLSPGYGYIVFTFPISFFDTSKIIYFPVIYGGSGTTKILYSISSIKSGTRTNVFSSANTQTGRSYGLYVSKMMFQDSPDYVEIGLRLDANDDDMKVGAALVYDHFGNLLTKINPDNQFGIQTSGSSSYRPDTLEASDNGFLYYDITLGKTILWNGTAWVNMDGTALS